MEPQNLELEKKPGTYYVRSLHLGTSVSQSRDVKKLSQSHTANKCQNSEFQHEIPVFCLYLFVYNSDSEPLLIIYRLGDCRQADGKGKKDQGKSGKDRRETVKKDLLTEQSPLSPLCEILISSLEIQVKNTSISICRVLVFFKFHTSHFTSE